MSTGCTSSPESGPHALNVSEIRLQIFAALDTPSLISAALVCKDWTWQAIDSIWRTQPIPFSWVLAPLMGCTANELRYVISEPLPPIITERWLDSAEKVTSLVIDLTWRVTQAARLDRRMESGGRIMFPNVISLDFDLDGLETSDEGEDEDRWTSLLSILVGPAIEKLSLAAYEITERVFQDNMKTLARIAPRIHTIVIKKCPSNFSPSYFPFLEMRYLRVEVFIDCESWDVLASCPRLDTIELAGFVTKSSGLTINPQDSVTFSHLKVLSVGYCFSGRNPQFATVLFQTTIMPRLQSLEVGNPENDEHRLSVWEGARNKILASVRGHSPMLQEFNIYGMVGRFPETTKEVRE